MVGGNLINALPGLREASLQKHSDSSDAELLELFIANRDEIAFEVLLRRHGPMVHAVCLRVLQHAQDAEDAFQATFLVLAHKASSVSPRSKLAGWLHGVAHKTALKARHRVHRRTEVEKSVPARRPDEMGCPMNSIEAEAVLDQEISGLPERYRLPIILCDLEGRLRVEVALILRCSEGTLSSRLTRGRRLLADRLKRRGLGPAVAGLTLVLTVSPALAESLILDTIPVALSSLASPAGVCGAISPNVAHLATGVMKSMFLHKLRLAAIGTFIAAALVVSALASYPTQAAPDAKAPAPTETSRAVPEIAIDIEGRILLNRKVLKDMKCDIDQLDKIMDILEATDLKATEKIHDMNVQMRALRGNTAAMQKAIQDTQEAIDKEFKKEVDGIIANILKPEQRKRMREIDLQVRGFEAFQLPAVAKALDLTAKQKEEMDKNVTQVKEEINKAIGIGFGGGGGGAGVGGLGGAGGAGGGVGGPGGFGGGVGGLGGGVGGPVGGGGLSASKLDKITADARAEGTKRALAILSDEQKALWKKMVGEPITYAVNVRKPGLGVFRMGGAGGAPGVGGPGGGGPGVLVPGNPPKTGP